jgi:glycosyltransferase involved in cell wall biosynthesis
MVYLCPSGVNFREAKKGSYRYWIEMRIEGRAMIDTSYDEQSKYSAYVVISPVKNEGEFIEQTIQSMLCQTVLPAQWVIVNDGSNDDTGTIVNRYAQKYPWIKLVNRPGSAGRKRGKGVVEAFYAGYGMVAVPYDFIVKLDGDVSFEPRYFETLLEEFSRQPGLGIAGGALYERPDGKTWKLHTIREHVRGATKMYRRTCFDAIGGLLPSMGWDGIDEWKALSKGWEVRSFFSIKLLHYRFTGAATGYLKSFFEQGCGAYRMGYHPLYISARGIRRMRDKPFIIGGLALIWGYFLSWIKREELLADPTVVQFIRQTQLRKLLGLVKGEKIYLNA